MSSAVNLIVARFSRSVGFEREGVEGGKWRQDLEPEERRWRSWMWVVFT